MSFLTSKQMAGLRTSVNSILTQTGTLTHRTLASDGYGGQTPTQTTSSVACRWIPFSAQEKAVVGATPEVIIGHILFASTVTVSCKRVVRVMALPDISRWAISVSKSSSEPSLVRCAFARHMVTLPFPSVD